VGGAAGKGLVGMGVLHRENLLKWNLCV